MINENTFKLRLNVSLLFHFIAIIIFLTILLSVVNRMNMQMISNAIYNTKIQLKTG